MDVERLRRPEPVRVPDRLHDLLARHQRARLLGEEGQQVVLLGGEGDLLAVQADAGGLAVDRQSGAVPVGAGLGRRTGLDAPHHRPYARDDLPYAEGLGDVVVGAEFQADDPVRLVAAGADDDDRHVTAFAQRPADVQAVGVGQAEVEQDDVVGLGVAEGRAARGHPRHLEAVAEQAAAQRLGHRFIVFHQEYAHSRTLWPGSLKLNSQPQRVSPVRMGRSRPSGRRSLG